MAAEPLHACNFQVGPVMLCLIRRLIFALGNQSHLVCSSPGMEVLVQRDVVGAIIGRPVVSAEEAPITAHIAPTHGLDGVVPWKAKGISPRGLVQPATLSPAPWRKGGREDHCWL